MNNRSQFPWKGDDDGGPRLGPGGWVWILVVIAGLAALIGYLWTSNPSALDGNGEAPRLVYLVALLAALGAGFLWHSAFRLRETLRHAVIWIGIALLLVAGYGFRDELGMIKNRVTGELFPQAGEIGDESVIYRRAGDGHFHIDAVVDGQSIRFLVDTGATSIVLGRADARRIGISTENLSYTVPTSTANGTAFNAVVRLEELRIGPIVARDVRAYVNGGEMSGSLLGMSFLDRLSGYEVRGDRLILRP